MTRRHQRTHCTSAFNRDLRRLAFTFFFELSKMLRRQQKESRQKKKILFRISLYRAIVLFCCYDFAISARLVIEQQRRWFLNSWRQLSRKKSEEKKRTEQNITSTLFAWRFSFFLDVAIRELPVAVVVVDFIAFVSLSHFIFKPLFHQNE